MDAIAMTKGIIIVGYGTRTGNLTEIIEKQAARMRARGIGNVYTAYFRISSPTIQEAVSRAVADGCNDILAIPYYIAEGRLTFEMIPAKLGLDTGSSRGTALVDGKEVRIRMASAFGSSPALTDILIDRIADNGGDMDTGILVLGHGSRDLTSSNEEIMTLNAKRLRAIGYRHVAHSFNEFVGPAIAEALKALAEEGVSRIIAVPLFIANGVHLGEEIPEQLGIPAYSEGGDIEIGGRKIQLVYTKPVEADPRLTDIIVAKAREFLGE